MQGEQDRGGRAGASQRPRELVEDARCDADDHERRAEQQQAGTEHQDRVDAAALEGGERAAGGLRAELEEEDGGEDQQRDIEPGALDQALALGASALAQVDAPARFEPGGGGEGEPGGERAAEREQPGLCRNAGVEQRAAADAGDRVERAGVVQREGGERRAQHGGGGGNPESEHRLRGGLLPGARAARGEPLAVIGGAGGDAASDQRDGEKGDGNQLEAG